MSSIINFLLIYIQYLEQTIRWLVKMLAHCMPLGQMAYDDANSPEYQKFKLDKLPAIIKFEKQDYEFLLLYYEWRYRKPVKPIKRKNGRSIPDDIVCPRCNAPHIFLYDNNGGKGEYLCKVCGQCFTNGAIAAKPVILACPYCGKMLQPKRTRKHFVVHTCNYRKCSYYVNNLRRLPKDLPADKRSDYKLHYVYREFKINFFAMDLATLPNNATGLKFSQKSAHIMGLCLTYHVNLSLSLRKTAQALKDIHGVNISHTMVANYAHTAAAVIKPFVVHYPYEKSKTFTADETYIKVRGVRAFVWFIMDAASRSIIGFRVSATRAVGDCILAMRMAFNGMTSLPENFRFIADGYSAYPLAAQQFELREDNPLCFDVTTVIGLSNDDAVSKEFRPFNQIVERLNRTFKATYRVTAGYDHYDGADYAVSLWVAYYNFLRPHYSNSGRVLNSVKEIIAADNMPARWQVLMLLGQQTILKLQSA